MLRSKGMINDAMARQIYVSNIVWALGQTAKGMYTASHERQAYPQLAAIQLGILTDAGALTWDPNATAANRQDKGAYTIHLDKNGCDLRRDDENRRGHQGRGDKKRSKRCWASTSTAATSFRTPPSKSDGRVSRESAWSYSLAM